MKNNIITFDELSTSLKNTLHLYKGGAVKGDAINHLTPRSRFAIRIHSALRRHYKVSHFEYGDIYTKNFSHKNSSELIEHLNEILGEVYAYQDK